MSFFDCVQSAMDDPEVKASRERGEKAQRMWQENADRFEAQGYSRHDAEVMAADVVKASFKKEAGAVRHTFLASMAVQKRIDLEVKSATDLAADAVQAMSRLDFQARGLKRHFDNKMGEYLQLHHRDLLERAKNPVQYHMLMREMYGESTGDEMAKAMADAVRHALEDMRIMANSAGANIGKIDNWFPQSHNRTSIINAGLDRWAGTNGWGRTRAKLEAGKSAANRDALFARSFEAWSDEVAPRLDWTKMTNDATGQPFQRPDGPPPAPETQRRLLREIFDNIAYGRNASDPKYGATQGAALHNRMSQSRVLYFKSADDWAAYNAKFGVSDPHGALMSHVHRMARDIAAMKNYGPNPNLGLQYRSDAIKAQAKARGLNPQNYEAKLQRAERMMAVYNGADVPSGYWQTMFANFMANTRHLQTAAFLDSAMLSSLSDLNSTKMAAQLIGADRTGPFGRYMSTITDMVKEGRITTDEMRQWSWVADTTADAGAAVARFNGEAPGGGWANVLSSSVMKLQGLSQHTDASRFAGFQIIAGQAYNQIGKPFRDIEPGLLTIMREHGISEKDWLDFAKPEWAMEAGNGAKFLNPLHWRAATDLPMERADDLFLKFQGAFEDYLELGTPTQSLFVRSFVDPTAKGLRPGEPMYEALQSVKSFKSFVMAHTHNIARSLRRMPDNASRFMWMAENVAGATVLGAMSLHLIELSKGNDPMNMNPEDHPTFALKAAMKGGGFAILGDLVVTGETKWGGGYAGYFAGPSFQLAGDAYQLTLGNLSEIGVSMLSGQPPSKALAESEAGREAVKALDRYLPGGDLPYVRAAVDRLIMDSLYKTLDPDGAKYIENRATRANNLNSTGSWWMAGSPTPDRLPNMLNAIGR